MLDARGQARRVDEGLGHSLRFLACLAALHPRWESHRLVLGARLRTSAYRATRPAPQWWHCAKPHSHGRRLRPPQRQRPGTGLRSTAAALISVFQWMRAQWRHQRCAAPATQGCCLEPVACWSPAAASSQPPRDAPAARRHDQRRLRWRSRRGRQPRVRRAGTRKRQLPCHTFQLARPSLRCWRRLRRRIARTCAAHSPEASVRQQGRCRGPQGARSRPCGGRPVAWDVSAEGRCCAALRPRSGPASGALVCTAVPRRASGEPGGWGAKRGGEVANRSTCVSLEKSTGCRPTGAGRFQAGAEQLFRRAYALTRGWRPRRRARGRVAAWS